MLSSRLLLLLAVRDTDRAIILTQNSQGFSSAGWGIGLLFLAALLLLAVLSLLFRQRSIPDCENQMETRTIPLSGRHNAFTDLISWNDRLWMVFRSAPSHFYSRNSRLVLLHSQDGTTWETAAEFNIPGHDLRDPKLGIFQESLLLIALLNNRFDPQPHQTILSSSQDGIGWSPFLEALPCGWLMGKPVSTGSSCYAPAHNLQTGSVKLWHSSDGRSWSEHALITAGKHADETAVVLLEDGRMISATRVEGAQAGTLLSSAAPPYNTWQPISFDETNRLDGPALLREDETIFAAGRRQPKTDGWLLRPGSILSRKRTALYRVGEQLTHLCDLPGSGDTSYPGLAIQNGKLHISFYSSRPDRDYPWLIGLILPTHIQTTIIPLNHLGAIVPPGKKDPS